MPSANSTGFKTVDTFTISFIYNILAEQQPVGR